jgi:hypothetical protein
MITRGIEVAQSRDLPVAGRRIEPPRPSVRRPRRGFDVQLAAAAACNGALDELEQRSAHALPLGRGRDGDPVQIE